MASPMATGTSAVFQPGPHRPEVRHVNQTQVPSVPKPLMVVTPTDAGAYPVAVFLHGFSMLNSWYGSLLSHVASHGFIAVAPQLYCPPGADPADFKDIDATRRVTAWLADDRDGLARVLADVFGLRGVRPDLSRLALAGHSRGGDTAFAVALGLGDTTTTPLPPTVKFSALVGVDPVAGLSKEAQMDPKVLTFRPGSLDPGMPVLVLGTGLGPKHVGGPPCAPAGVNHVEFYDECVPPKYHAVVKDYGHLDMLDDGAPPYPLNCMCLRNLKDDAKVLARRAIGGLMVAFLRATLEDDDEDLMVVLKDPGLSPAVLNSVAYDLAC